MLGKKTNNTQPGLVWMPYIPIKTVETISEVSQRISMKSRYSTKIVNSSYYGVFGNGKNYMSTRQKRKSKIENIFKIEET